MGKPVVEVELDGLDEGAVKEAVGLITELGGEPRSYDGDMTSMAEVLALVVLVVTPLKPFLDGMLQRAGEGVMERLLALLPGIASPDPSQSAATPLPTDVKGVLDGERGHVFLFREGAPPRTALAEALRALAELDSTALPDNTQWFWDTPLGRWAALPPAPPTTGS
ncbi:hypothetical protein JHN63_21170 [Streptomyces sp. MBT65]|uniref:hypothetical protein n=1 Tax=Streptomyces sp. MBT65 TaxID=1488395 RepID=UPI001909D430|nr:hypothetical protein [Streptomyces sp. MBT65]MBK3576284.1 hypothetical protein [Streptomyces sp. MBT65]